MHQGDQLALGSGEVRGQERSVLCRFFLPLTLPGPWPAAIQPSGPLKVRGEVGGTGGRHRWKAPGVRGHLRKLRFAECPPEFMPRPQKEEQISCLRPPGKVNVREHSQVGSGTFGSWVYPSAGAFQYPMGGVPALADLQRPPGYLWESLG